KHLEVIALAIGIEREFPVGTGGENALFDGLRAIEFELRKDRAEIAQMRLGIDRRSVRAGSHEDEAKMLGTWQFDEIARADLAIGKPRLAGLTDEGPLRVECPGMK